MDAEQIAAAYIEAMLHVRALKKERTESANQQPCKKPYRDEAAESTRWCHERSYRFFKPADYCPPCKKRYELTRAIASAAAVQGTWLKLYIKAKVTHDGAK